MLNWLHSALLLRASLVGIISLVACACVDSSEPPTLVTTVFFGTLDNKFHAVDALTGNEKWQVTNQENIVSPEVSDGVVYALSDHQLYAMDAETGQKKWTFSSEDVGTNHSPAIGEGTVYFVGNDGRKLYALDAATGRKKWAISAPGYTTTDHPNSYGRPMAANGKLYIGGSTAALYALNARTGLLEQKFTVGEYTYGAPLLANGVLYAGSYDGKLYAFDITTGQQKWTSNLGSFLGDVKLIGQTLYVQNWQQVFAVNANTGAQQWRSDTASAYRGGLSISGGTIYGCYVRLDSREASIYSLDATTGAKKGATWPWPGGYAGLSNIVVANGLLYAVGRDKKLCALDTTDGSIKWSVPTSDVVTSSLCVLTKEGD